MSRLRRARQILHKAVMPKQLSRIVEMDETKAAKNWFWGAIEWGSNRAIVEWIPNRQPSLWIEKFGNTWKNTRLS